MKAIAEVLNEQDISVCLLSLRGHGDNFQNYPGSKSHLARMKAFRSVSYEIWRKETRLAYGVVRELADEKQVPVIFVGYSLGSLMGCDLLTSVEDVKCDRMILFAPALTHRLNQSFKILSPFKSAILPSRSPRYYRANSGTPIAAYIALLDASIHFTRCISRKLNVPTAIFINKQDELVSYKRLKKFVAYHRLDKWKTFRIRKNLLESIIEFNHLMIDEKTAGPVEWDNIRLHINDHLQGIGG